MCARHWRRRCGAAWLGTTRRMSASRARVIVKPRRRREHRQGLQDRPVSHAQPHASLGVQAGKEGLAARAGSGGRRTSGEGRCQAKRSPRCVCSDARQGKTPIPAYVGARRPRMSVEAMMSEGRMLYGEWCSAELELRQARNRQPSSFAALSMRAALLEQHCRSALDAIDAALAAAHSQAPPHCGERPRCPGWKSWDVSAKPIIAWLARRAASLHVRGFAASHPRGAASPEHEHFGLSARQFTTGVFAATARRRTN
jgi:hypothetical protein